MEYLDILILVVSFVILLAIGVPIAYSIGLSAILTMVISIDVIPSFTTLSQRIATALDSFALLAIPFFYLCRPVNEQGGDCHPPD